MNPMRLLIAVGVLAVLAGLVYWSEENPPSADDDTTPIVELAADDVQAVTVERPGHDTIAVQRGEGEKWTFAPPLTIPADDSSVALLLNNLTPMNADRVVEKEVTDWRPYGLEGEAWALRVDVKAKKDEAEKFYRVIFGNDTPTGAGVYVRLDGDPRLFTVFNHVKSSFEKEIFDLRDKKLLKLDPGKVSRVTVNVGPRSIEFGKSGAEDWQILKPAPLRADNFAVGDAVRAVQNAEMVAVLGEGEAAGKYSFERPAVTVEVVDEAGAHTLTIAKGSPNGSGEKHYAKSSDIEGVYEVSSTLAEALDKPVEDFRNKKVFNFGFVDPASVQVRDGDTRLTIEKRENKWVLTSGGDRELDSEKVQALLDDLRGLSVKAFTSDAQADQERYGLGTPVIEAEVVQANGAATEKVIITDPEAERVYGAIPGQPSTHELEKGDVEGLRTNIAAVAEPAEEPTDSAETTP